MRWGAGMRRSWLGLIVGACLVTTVTPAGATQAGTNTPGPAKDPTANALTYLSVSGAPIAPLNASLQKLGQVQNSVGGEQRIAQLRAAIAEEVETFEYSFVEAIHDITGDGVEDAIVIHDKETVTVGTDDTGFPTFSFDGKTTFSARHGRTGRELWSLTEKSTDGWSWFVEGDVGPKVEAGFIIIKDQGWSTNQPYVELSAISGKDASPLWQTRLDSTYVDDPTYVTGAGTTHDAPWITGLGNFVPGRADDLLVGLMTYAQVGYYSTLYDTGVVVIDGTDGSRVDHPAREKSVDWIPIPWALGDQDGDGLRDYAFGNNVGVVVTPGPEVGDPPTVELGGVMRLRKGSTGEVIWEEGGLDLGQLAAAYSVGQQFGGTFPEFFILVWDWELDLLTLPVPAPMPLPIGIGGISHWRELTYVMDGSGRVRFMKNIWMIHAPGRIDGDDEGDFIGWRTPFGQKGIRVKLLAFNSKGEKLWTREHMSPAPEGVCKNLCSTFGYIGVGDAGDLQPDDGLDLFFVVDSQRADAKAFDHYTVDGLTGRKLHEGGEELWAPGFSFDRHGADLLEIYRNNGSIDVKTREGTHGSTLIEATIGSDLPAVQRNGVGFDLGDVTGDGCSDVLFTIDSTGGTYAVVLDGGSGKPLWSEVLQGPDRKISTETTTDRNKAC